MFFFLPLEGAFGEVPLLWFPFTCPSVPRPRTEAGMETITPVYGPGHILDALNLLAKYTLRPLGTLESFARNSNKKVQPPCPFQPQNRNFPDTHHHQSHSQRRQLQAKYFFTAGTRRFGVIGY